MDEYAGRILADRYRLPLPPSDEYELAETRAYDTYSGQEVLVRQVPLPEVVEAEVLDADGLPEGFVARDGGVRRASARTTRRPTEPAVRRAIEAAQAAAQIPDHPRLDQVFDVFAEGGSLWIVSELVAARRLDALLAERPLSPYRAAEIASDVLAALRVLHAHGWVHRNITVRTVLVCDDGRVMLTGLAAGAAEEALCGYDPVPVRDFEGEVRGGGAGAGGPGGPGGTGDAGAGRSGGAGGGASHGFGPGGAAGLSGALGGGGAGGAAAGGDPEAARRAAIEARAKRGGPAEAAAGVGPRALEARGAGGTGGAGGAGGPGGGAGSDMRAARAGAIAAYRAGARAAARVHEEQRGGRAALPAARPSAQADASAAQAQSPVQAQSPFQAQSPVQAQGQAQGQGAGQTAQTSGHEVAGYSGFPQASGGSGGSGFPQAPGHGGQAQAQAQGLGRGQVPAQGLGHGQAPVQAPGHSPAQAQGSYQVPSHGTEHRPNTAPPGQIADPYGVGHSNSWHGAQPRGGSGTATGTGGGVEGRPALPGVATGGMAAPGGDTGSDTSPGMYSGSGTSTSPLPGSGTPTGAPQGNIAPALVPGQPFAPAPAAVPTPTPGPGTPATTPQGQTARWDQIVASGPPRRGPATALAAERARQARMAVVGPVTERWAPEQAGPVHENWQLAAPIGPATDLWALGALLFRAVQGHAPYPEENTAELVQLVCAEPPAFAEECGPLRPVVESLLRQDPTERLDFEELRGWLRSLVRSAPEAEAGAHVVAAPPVNPSRLPIVRRRGELVRRRRAGLPATSPHARHKRAKQNKQAKPRRLGRNLVLLILLVLAAAIAYAMVFMPKSESNSGTDDERTGSAGDVSPAPDTGAGGSASSEPRPDQTSPGGDKSPSASSSSTSPGSNDPDVAQGFTLREDAEGFQVAVANGWDRAAKNGSGQVVYSNGDFELILVPGRDSTSTYGSDPMTYQREREGELQPFRDSTWATSSGMRRIDVGGLAMAEGQFTWTDGEGHELFVRNLAIIIDGRYHVVQVRGPEAERDEVTRLYEQASGTYRVTG
ncbi:protein kinase [Streptomyces sp. NPDC000888]